MQIKLKSGKKYSICSCGLSKSLPYCDNFHRKFNAENETEYKSIKITPVRDITIEVTSSHWISTGKEK